MSQYYNENIKILALWSFIAIIIGKDKTKTTIKKR